MPSNSSCPCEGGTLDRHLQPTILALLVYGPEHGYGLAAKLSESSLLQGCKPDGPGLYRCLAAMEGQGLVKHVVTPSSSGPAKRLYKLTPKGKKCLGKWIDTLQRYHQCIGKLIRLMKHSQSKLEA